MATRDFPDEILLHIAHYVGAHSTHDLRDLALVGRRWYLITAPILLSTIAVSSLGDLVRLCDHLASAHKAYMFLLGCPATTEQPYVSMIAHHTRTIVMSGTWWPRNLGIVADYHTGLDQYQPAGGGALPPDVEIPYFEMMAKLGESIPHLKQLNSLEWYGRFPGDYYLATYLLKTRHLSQLTLCIDTKFVTASQSYCNTALAFKRLTRVTLEASSLDSPANLTLPTLNMLRRNRNLEQITVILSDRNILTHVVSDPTSPDSPFTWPHLRHLELRGANVHLWDVAETSDLFARFLVAHPLLKTLILQSHVYSPDDKLPHSFSLAPYPHALPNLQTLRAPLAIVAGILESTSAASSLTEITDLTMGRSSRSDSEQLFGRVTTSFERVSNSPLRRLKIQVPRFDYDHFMRFSKRTPSLKVLEFETFTVSRQPKGDEAPIAMMVEVIPSGLNLFRELETIGRGIAGRYNIACGIKSPGTSFNASMMLLAEGVPGVRSVHIGDGMLLMVDRDGSGKPKSVGELGYLDNVDGGHLATGRNEIWTKRPKSKNAEELYKRSLYADRYIHLYEPNVDPDL